MNVWFWDEAIAVGILVIAVVMSVACHNDPAIRESPIKTAGRRLTIVSQVLATAWVVWLTFEPGGHGMNQPAFFVFLLWGLGSIMSSLDYIGRRWGREISELVKPQVYYERRKQPRGRTQ
jgi:hypothetical protein